MWRVAIYAREAPDRDGRARLDRQVGQLAAQVTRQPGCTPVATYVDQRHHPASFRPGLSRLIADAPGHFDVVAVDSYGRLSPNRRQLGAILGQPIAAGVTTIVLRPSAGRRFARAVANFALADLIGEALR
jgi:DNA invertase Pin-like site-specific DNA recombinase